MNVCLLFYQSYTASSLQEANLPCGSHSTRASNDRLASRTVSYGKTAVQARQLSSTSSAIYRGTVLARGTRVDEGSTSIPSFALSDDPSLCRTKRYVSPCKCFICKSCGKLLKVHVPIPVHRFDHAMLNQVCAGRIDMSMQK